MYNQISLFLRMSKRIIVSLWHTSKFYIFVSFIEIILTAFVPFIHVLIPAKIINYVMVGDKWNAIRNVLLWLILDMSSVASMSCIKHYNDIKFEFLNNVYQAKLMEKSMTIDFELAETTMNLEKKKKAERGAVNIIEYFKNFKIFVSNFISLVIALYLFSRINYLLVIIIFLVVILNSYVNYKKNIAEHKREDEFSVLYRKWDYLNLICRDKEFYKEIRLNHLSDWLAGKISSFTQENEDLIRSGFKYTAYARNFSAFGEGIQNAAIYCIIGYQVIKGIIVIGDYLKYLSAVGLAADSLVLMSTNIFEMQRNCLYIDNYFSYLDLPDQDSNKLCRRIPLLDYYEIKIENVWFKYTGKDDYVLKDFSLTIKYGEKLSIVGLNGAGKTTLIKLILRIYKPERGVIKLNGIDIQEYDLKEYRKVFAVLFQDYKIFSFTVRDNILMSDEILNSNELNLSCKNKIADALQKTGLDEKIRNLPNGYNTFLNNDYEAGGIELSGGMSQNLAISRVYYRNAKIVIMDEPTAMLDPLHEYHVYKYMRDIIGKQTAIYISHRMSCSKFCDKIAFIVDGRVKEYGTHDELLKKGELYYKLYKTQEEYYK